MAVDLSAIAPVWALVPIKPPAATKTRLAAALGAEERAELAAHMAHDVLTALNAASGLASVAVLAADQSAVRGVQDFRCRVLEDERPGDLCGSLGKAAARIEAEGARTLVIVPADLPALTGSDIDGLLARHWNAVSIVPAARDGGTNALVLTPPSAIECQFGPDSARRHLDAARRAGLTATRLELPGFARDIDTVDDVLWFCGRARGGRTREYLERAGICSRLGRERRHNSA
jgi:2-phospho-L-lactate guanylyltransferase